LENEKIQSERLESENLERKKIEKEKIENKKIERENPKSFENERTENEIKEIENQENSENKRSKNEIIKKGNHERELKREKSEIEEIENVRLVNDTKEKKKKQKERSERKRIESERVESERVEGEGVESERLERDITYIHSNDNMINKKKTLVIATKAYEADEYYELDIKKGEFLIVTDFDYKEGWVYGHRKDNEEEKGIFPKVFIEIYEDKNEITLGYKIRFEEKINKLRSLKEMNILESDTFIVVNRNDLFRDAFDGIMRKTPQELKKRLRIVYNGEEGVDTGGLLRYYYYYILFIYILLNINIFFK